MKEKIYRCRWLTTDDEQVNNAIMWLIRQGPWQRDFLVNITRTGMTITKCPMRPEVLFRKLALSPKMDRSVFLNKLSRERNVTLLWTFLKTVLLTSEEAGIYENMVKRQIRDGRLEIEDISGKEMSDQLQSVCTNVQCTTESYSIFARLQGPSLPNLPILQVYRSDSVRYSLPTYSSDNSANGQRANSGASNTNKIFASLQCETCTNGTKDCVFVPCGDLYQCCTCAADVNICSKCAATICDKKKVSYALCKDCKT